LPSPFTIAESHFGDMMNCSHARAACDLAVVIDLFAFGVEIAYWKLTSGPPLSCHVCRLVAYLEVPSRFVISKYPMGNCWDLGSASSPCKSE
jgi:hypothetical protein